MWLLEGRALARTGDGPTYALRATADKLAVAVLLLGLNAFAQSAGAQTGGGGQPGPPEATPQRPTFTSDTSTTAPGTLELEIGTTSSDSFFGLPLTIKYTPDVGGLPALAGLLRETEFSLAFEAVTSISLAGERRTEFGDRLTFALRRPVYRGEQFSLAVAPQATFFVRDGKGARLGATLLGAYSFGRNTAVANFTWTSATSSSATNAAQQYDLAFDLARTLGASGALSRVGVFAGALVENPSNQKAAVSLGQGITYRVRPNWVVDFAVRELGLAEGRADYQILAGLTVNLGRWRNW